MQIEESLKDLGLNDKEVRTYIALLELGQATAYATAQKSDLKQSITYVVLEELRKKGLVLKVPHVKRQLFIAKSPEEFLAESEDKIKRARHMLPELLALASGPKKPRTLYFEGEKGIKDFLNYGIDKMEGKYFTGFYAHTEGIPRKLFPVIDDYHLTLRKKNIGIQGIVPEHSTLKSYRNTDKEYSRRMKVVPYEKYSANVSIDIGPTFVKMFAPKDMQGVIIENTDIARTMNQIFEMVWEK